MVETTPVNDGCPKLQSNLSNTSTPILSLSLSPPQLPLGLDGFSGQRRRRRGGRRGEPIKKSRIIPAQSASNFHSDPSDDTMMQCYSVGGRG